MELDLPKVVAQEVVEVLVEVEGVPGGWEVTYLGPDPVGIVSALIVELGYPIRWVHPAIA